MKTILESKCTSRLFRLKALLVIPLILFVCTPAIEVVLCIFNEVQRIIPFESYSFLILKIIQPIGYLLLIGSIFYLMLNEKLRITIKNLLKSKTTRLFLALVFLILISTFINGLSTAALFGDWYRNEPISLVLSYFLIFYLFATQIDSSNMKKRIILLSLFISLIVAIYAVWFRLYYGEKYISLISPYLISVFFQHNHYGYYLAIHIMLSSGLYALADKKSEKVFAAICLIINTAILSFNNTFGAWLACFCSFIFQIIVIYFAKHKFDKASFQSFVIFLFITFLMSFWTDNIFSSIMQFFVDVDSIAKDPQHADSAGTTRWMLWKFTIKKIAEKPLFGFGNEGIKAMLEEATGSTRPHNEFLQYTVFYGIPAGLLYILGCFSVFIHDYILRAFLDNETNICLIASFCYLVSSFFGNTMFYTTPFLFILLGFSYSTK